ncbi:unnamed protein product [Adineta ricciae]|uniref:ADP ribosyltransferase domain-containing protein n=3 Tax=Adineta ricciae TaxID=249248 RepID=A0A815HTF4_ADIRI|nr:unnamed protein product [Adineta ricciae]
MLGNIRTAFKGRIELNTRKTGRTTRNRTVRTADRTRRQGRSTADNSQEDVTVIWLTSEVNNEEEHPLVQSLRIVSTVVKVYKTIEEVITCLQSANDEKFFLIIQSDVDHVLTTVEPYKQIDSIFLYTHEIPERMPTRLKAHCVNETELVNNVKQARFELGKQAAAFSVYNQAEKATRDLTRETGSFLFFQLFKTALLSMTKTEQAKTMMISKCRDYYRGNEAELANITEFEETYESSEAIPWYTRESFVYKLINKALRTEDVDALYHFRYYIVDLCVELDKNFQELKATRTDPVLHLYRGFKASREEIRNFENNIGNLISTNGFLSTSNERQVAYGFATKPVNRPNLQRVLFEYKVDITVVKKIIVADIRKYSDFPEEAEMLVDLGASFQIDSCTYSEEEDLWFVTASASDQGAAAAEEYIEYQKAKMAESNMVLMFGHLLVEMGEYIKAEKYFYAILYSSNPNDEEIACIYHNIGRAHRRKGEFDRALQCFNRSYQTHLTARPPRLMSAAKTINAIGILYIEQGDIHKAKESFERALKLYTRTVNRHHPDIGGTLVNLGNIFCQQEDYDQASIYFKRAEKIFQRRLPSNHPNLALSLNNFGNLHYQKNEYEQAMNAFKTAHELKEKILPPDHPDLAGGAYNLAVLHTIHNEHELANQYFEKSNNCTLPESHPFRQMLKSNIIFQESTTDKQVEDIENEEPTEYPILRL